MERVLVSACLLGAKVRFHGGSAELAGPVLERWRDEGRLVSFCPEVEGGLPTPRPPAEICRQPLPHGERLLRVIASDGRDVTEPYRIGADAALIMAQRHRIRVAILKDGSPSCGSSFVYDGTFSGRRTAGEGLTTARLRAAGVSVFSEGEIEAAAELVTRLETGAERRAMRWRHVSS
jgi:uncharacterized protein YbbK (DUF523 family)